MAPESRILVVVEPALIDRVASYLDEPRKRESIVLSLAEPAAGPASTTGTVERAAALAARLDGLVRARNAVRSGGLEATHEYARRLWNDLAWLAASAGPSWAQGGCCSLAMLAYPERHSMSSDVTRSVRHLSRAVRYLLTSTARVAPTLGLSDCELALPAWGGSGRASGCIPAEFSAWLIQLLSGARFPLEPLAKSMWGAAAAHAWRKQAVDAAVVATWRGGHLVEADASVLRAQCFVTPRGRSRFDWGESTRVA